MLFSLLFLLAYTIILGQNNENTRVREVHYFCGKNPSHSHNFYALTNHCGIKF